MSEALVDDRRCESCRMPGARRDPVYRLDLCDVCWAVRRPHPGGLSPRQMRLWYPETARRLGL